MSNNKCSIPDCKFKDFLGSSYFNFPESALLEKWCESLKLDKNTIKPQAKICHHHFDKKYIIYVKSRKKTPYQYSGKKRRQLSRDAIPTILDPSESDSVRLKDAYKETKPFSIRLDPLPFNVDSVLSGMQKIRIAENDEIKILDVSMIDSPGPSSETISSTSSDVLPAPDSFTISSLAISKEELSKSKSPESILAISGTFIDFKDEEHKSKKKEDEKIAADLKELRRLDLGDNSTFFKHWSPLQSQREARKVVTSKKKPVRKRHTCLHNEVGVHIGTGLDLCDCLDLACPGCHFPCRNCGSGKCGPECRINRRWIIEEVEVQSTNLVFRHPHMASQQVA